MKNKKGFTLIELLVVIAIIGVLASIVLASLNSTRRKSRDVRRITDIKQIQLALELYLYGAGAAQYLASNTTCDGTDSNGLQPLVTNGYIPVIPRDPSNVATCYQYSDGVVGGEIRTYHLGAVLEDVQNTAFNGDKDCDSTDNLPECTSGAAFTNGFDASADPTNRIYDVGP